MEAEVEALYTWYLRIVGFRWLEFYPRPRPSFDISGLSVTLNLGWNQVDFTSARYRFNEATGSGDKIS